MDNNQPGVPSGQSSTPQGSKHMKPFWPIFIIIVVSVIAGGVIMYYVSDTERQEEINSIFFMNRKSATGDKASSGKCPADQPNCLNEVKPQ